MKRIGAHSSAMRGLLWMTLAIATPATAATVGVQLLTVPDPASKPIAIAVWYPSEGTTAAQNIGPFSQNVALDGRVSGRALPLILISHGTGGSFSSHSDTALALAQAGFVVAALTHTGDNYMDQSYSGSRKNLTERPRQAALVLDYMLTKWADHDHLDPARVGMFGFSMGGFTTLVESGGNPEPGRLLELCSTHPTAPECVFVRRYKSDGLDPVTTTFTWVHDHRVKAIVVAAPAVSCLFGPGSLKDVKVPIQLWRAANDEEVPDEWNTALVRKELPNVEEHVVPRANHYVFLAPCTDSLAQQVPQICTDPAGVDRVAVHRDFNREVVAFFRRTLSK